MLFVVLKIATWLITVAIAVTSLLPLLHSHQWWIRMWDFPRLHIFIAACSLILLAITVLRSHSFIAVTILAACAFYQAIMIYPYTPLSKTEIELADVSDRPTVSLLSANVLMENEQHDRLADLIQEESPDILFLMETDKQWAEALAPTLAEFKTVRSHPLDNYYGLIFATNLGVDSAEVVFLQDAETPTLIAELRAPDGAGFHFIGLHPRPPVPGEDTDERDAQIKRVATITKDSNLPVITMGDFNDVAWSWTAKRFKHHGDFLDPRVGRGMLSSFDANHPILRFPIDQLYLTESIDLISFERKRAVGSDHFPIGAVVSIGGQEKD